LHHSGSFLVFEGEQAIFGPSFSEFSMRIFSDKYFVAAILAALALHVWVFSTFFGTTQVGGSRIIPSPVLNFAFRVEALSPLPPESEAVAVQVVASKAAVAAAHLTEPKDLTVPKAAAAPETVRTPEQVAQSSKPAEPVDKRAPSSAIAVGPQDSEQACIPREELRQRADPSGQVVAPPGRALCGEG
jgi:hypothetical protein